MFCFVFLRDPRAPRASLLIRPIYLNLISYSFRRMKRQNSQDAVKCQSEFHRKLQGGQIAPLYLFEGSERYLRDQALKKLLEVAVEESARDFNFARISV